MEFLKGLKRDGLGERKENEHEEMCIFFFWFRKITQFCDGATDLDVEEAWSGRRNLICLDS